MLFKQQINLLFSVHGHDDSLCAHRGGDAALSFRQSRPDIQLQVMERKVTMQRSKKEKTYSSRELEMIFIFNFMSSQ